MFDWSITHNGGVILIDPPDVPSETIAVCDIETNGQDGDQLRIVCIGLCTDGVNARVYFNLSAELISYLRRTQLVCHNGKGAEIPWLSKYGITIEQLYDDTQIMAYVFDSSRKSFGLKKVLKDTFGVEYPSYSELIKNKEVIHAACLIDMGLYDKKGAEPKKLTLDQMPREIVAEYNACDTFYTYKLWMHYRQQFNAQQKMFYKNIELPTTKLLFHMEQQGVAIDTKAVRRIHGFHSKERRASKKAALTVAQIPGLNLNSPKQLLPLVQRELPEAQGTGEEILESPSKGPFCTALLSYRKHQKICSTYTTPLYFNAITDKENRIYARFNQNTITGRLSSSDPINLQNQPPAVREAFCAKPGYRLVGADWSNIELRLPASFANEPGYVQELSRRDGDLHWLTAQFLFPELLHLSEEEQKEKRKKAKTCNFLLTNSGTAHRLGVELGVDQSEAEDLFERFWKGYPALKAWLETEKKEARKAGYACTRFGRKVYIPTLLLTCEWGSWKCGKEKTEQGYLRTCKNCRIREEAERSAISVLVQGTAADMMKLAAQVLYREYGYVPVLAVHDELVYEIMEDSADIAAKRIQDVMENITTLKVPLFANVKSGLNWKEVH